MYTATSGGGCFNDINATVAESPAEQGTFLWNPIREVNPAPYTAKYGTCLCADAMCFSRDVFETD